MDHDETTIRHVGEYAGVRLRVIRQGPVAHHPRGVIFDGLPCRACAAALRDVFGLDSEGAERL